CHRQTGGWRPGYRAVRKQHGPSEPNGFGLEWTAMSYQERLSGAQAPALYGKSVTLRVDLGGARINKKKWGGGGGGGG
ncbi:hypothetical protein, partial [Escherichia coli]|uniref:hypothetical protein n=1 Tax=Escherichia coli TaxID=562 RepID=UPI003F81715A